MENTNNVKLFNKLKNLIFKAEKFGDAKLEDGRIINWEGEFTVGSILNVISEDGTVTTLEPNEYQIDGKMVKVGEMGDILEISDMKEEVADVAEEDLAKTDLAVDAPVDVPVEDVKQDVIYVTADDLAKMMEDISKRLDALEGSQKMNGEFKEDFNAVKELVNIIANEPIEKTHVDEQTFAKTKKTNKKTDLLNMINQVRTNK